MFDFKEHLQHTNKASQTAPTQEQHPKIQPRHLRPPLQ